MVKEEDVIWCYRNLLGRDPESVDAIYVHIACAKNWQNLVTNIITSPEYLALRPKYSSLNDPRFGFAYDDSHRVQNEALGVLKLLEPVSVENFTKIRIGQRGDGGYVMLDDFDSVQYAYSFGIANDVSWDKDIASKGITVHQYDHTIDGLPESHPNFRWSKTGLGNVYDPIKSLNTLANLITTNGHDDEKELIIKLDIEGAEWSVLDGLEIDVLKKFRQIVGEFHGLQLMTDPDWAALLKRTFAKLTTNHRVIHVHGNNNAAYSIVGGIPVPASLELSFVRNDNKQMIRSNESFPTPLDDPSWHGRADHRLSTFRFS